MLLLLCYVAGTRQWMFDEVNAWLTATLTATTLNSARAIPRMFLLLAGPGMGKSVFSAVMQNKLTVQKHKNHKLVQVGFITLFALRHFMHPYCCTHLYMPVFEGPARNFQTCILVKGSPFKCRLLQAVLSADSQLAGCFSLHVASIMKHSGLSHPADSTRLRWG